MEGRGLIGVSHDAPAAKGAVTLMTLANWYSIGRYIFRVQNVYALFARTAGRLFRRIDLYT
jgi:hypothetical protein